MTQSINSISQQEKERMEAYTSSIEILSKLTQALTKNDLTVNLTLKDKNGNDVEITLPNLYAIDSDIKRLDKNIKALSGLDASAYIKGADGKYQKIIATKTNKTPSKINNLQVPVTFDRRNNWFFENFLSPLLYIDFDLSTLIDDQIGKISVKRVIVNTQTSAQVDLFNSALKSRNDLNYEEVLSFLKQQQLSYFTDDDVYDLPPSVLRYEGSFGILKSFNSYDTNLQREVKYYKLSNINYTDNLEAFKNNNTLKVGDVLSLNDSTKFEILTIDIATKQVTLKRLSGKDSLPIGDNVLSLESKKHTSKSISINVGFGEKQIIFVKPINTEFNLTTTSYSNGVCFDSNELILKNSNGDTVTLEEYYNKEVTDFGMYILNLSKEKTIPAIFGNIPKPPRIDSNNFKVVQINTHLEQDDLTKNIRVKLSEKVRLKNEIDNLDTEVFSLNSKIQSSNYSTSERKQLESKIDVLIDKKRSKLSEYTSLLTDINNISKSTNVDSIKPKYRVRGFWDYPTPIENSRVGKENIIQFIGQYRYLNNNGAGPNVTQLKYSATDGASLEGVYSNWIEFKTKPRERYYDLTEGVFLWDTDDTADVNKVNSNQLDIPIKTGESIEVRIKSVSEAGYPTNPLTSAYSESIIIDFPEGLNSEIDLYSLLEEAAREEERSFIYRQLQEYGLERHFRTTLVRDNKYYAHAAFELFSGFSGSNGEPISVYDKLLSLENQITSLQKQLNTQTPIEIKNGKLIVSLIGKGRDGSLMEYPITNNTTLDLQLPDYYSYVSKLPVGDRRGAIVKEEYKIKLTNSGDGVLHLNSKYPGAVYEGLPTLSGTNLIWKNSSWIDDSYLNLKRYDKVPVRYKTFSNYENIKDIKETFGYAHQQSSQVAGQFIYARYKDVTGVTNLYGTGGVLQPQNMETSPASNANTRGFVWDYTWFNPNTTTAPQINPYSMNPNGGGILSDFCIHINHVDLKENRKVLTDLLANKVLTKENLLEHSKYFNLESGTSDALKQNEITKNQYGKFTKFGFYENDRYLIGKNTTGMYFYMNPDSPQSIRTTGNDSQSSYALQPGESILIPIVVEYRMTDFYDESDNYIVNKQINSTNINISDLTAQLKINQNSVSALHLNDSIVTGKQYLGVVGGYSQSNLNRKNLNITYEKVLGFDIFSKNNTTFSFDIKAKASYGSTQNSILIDESSYVNDLNGVKISNKTSVVLDNSLLNNRNTNLI